MTTKEINGAFEEFLFDWESDYYCLVGGYGSSKSYHAALKIIMKLLQEKRLCLVVRDVYATLKDSCFALLNDIIHDLRLGHVIKSIKSPLEINFANGSKIIFRGADDEQKLKSIHNVDLIWIEESSSLKFKAFKELVGRLRHPTLKLHMILTTNPISKSNWMYTFFFKDEENGRVVLEDEEFYGKKGLVVGKTYYHHSTYHDNKFLPPSYCDNLEEMKEYDPVLHQVAALGRFGQLGELLFNNVYKDSHENIMNELKSKTGFIYKNGCDLGFVTSYNAFIQCAINHKEKILYIFNEHYNRNESDAELADALALYKKEVITFDSAEPKTIAYMRQRGFKAVKAKKGPGSVIGGIKKLKRFKKIVISDNCPNAQKEFSTIAFAKDKNDNIIEDKFSFDGHSIDSVRYAIESYELPDYKGDNIKKF